MELSGEAVGWTSVKVNRLRMDRYAMLLIFSISARQKLKVVDEPA